MLIKSPYNIIQAWKVTGLKFLLFFIYAACIASLESYLNFDIHHFSTSTIAIFGTGVSIFLGFRINSAYGRWWEARMIWGSIVNNSRNFGSTIAIFLSKSQCKEIVYNLIGFLAAARLSLRKAPEETWQKELWNYRVNQEPLFTPEEVDKLKRIHNKPSQIIYLISHKLSKALKSSSHDSDYKQVYLNQLILPMYDNLGKAERIKNTVFPWGYRFYTLRFVWLLALAIPLTFTNGLDVFRIIECALASTLFVTAEQVANNLDNSFENNFNDTPMTAISRTIEIDLLEQLEISPVPEPIKPTNGILN